MRCASPWRLVSASARVVAVAALASACVALVLMPSPVRLVQGDGFRKVRAEVLSVDDSGIQLHGLLEYGTQRLRVRLRDGTEADAFNEIRAQLDLDKKFAPGDTALVAVPVARGSADALVACDHWRLGWAFALFACFAAFLCWFGRWPGVRALFTFFFSCLVVWKYLVPAVLAGRSAVWSTLLAVVILSAAIIFLVAGLTRKGAAAFLGSILGVVASLALVEFFSGVMHVNGATMPFVQQLLYSGCPGFDMADVFVGSAILASSGAVMDLGMDIAAGVEEVSRHNKSLGFRELWESGCRIGRAVVGTMTTTLLLAYSGGYITLLMAFAANGTSPADFLNSTLVSAELVKTLVGSFGLVLVAPFTAFVAAALFARRLPKDAADVSGERNPLRKTTMICG